MGLIRNYSIKLHLFHLLLLYAGIWYVLISNAWRKFKMKKQKRQIKLKGFQILPNWKVHVIIIIIIIIIIICKQFWLSHRLYPKNYIIIITLIIIIIRFTFAVIFIVEVNNNLWLKLFSTDCSSYFSFLNEPSKFQSPTANVKNTIIILTSIKLGGEV